MKKLPSMHGVKGVMLQLDFKFFHMHKSRNFLLVDLRESFFRFRVMGGISRKNSKTRKVNQQSVLTF